MTKRTIPNEIIARLINAACFFGSLLFVWALCVPWNPGYPFWDFESSWWMAMHYAFEKGWHFGREVIYPRGLYSFLATCIYYPTTYGYIFYAYLYFATVYVVASWALFKKVIRNPVWILGLIVSAAFFYMPLPIGGLATESFFYSSGLILFASYFAEGEESCRPQNFFLILVLACASLMKATFFMEAFLILGFISVTEWLSKKKPPYLMTFWIAMMMVYWLIARQSLPDFGLYLRNQLPIVKYYSTVWSCDPPFQKPEFYGYLVGFALLLVALGAAQCRQRGRQAILPVVTLASLVFLFFRAGFTRGNGAIVMALIPVSAIYLIPILSKSLKGRFWKMFLSVSLIFSFFLGFQYGGRTLYRSTAEYVKYVRDSIFQMPHFAFKESRFLFYDEDLRRNFEKIQSFIRAARPLPPVPGSVDIFPYEVSRLLANRLDYCPRPTIQSGTAYSPYLLQKNAEFLRSAKASEYLIFATVYGKGGLMLSHYPTLDDSLFLREVMSRYEFVKAIDDETVLLKKSSQPRPYTLQPLAIVQAEFGKSVSVPAFAGGLWVEIDLRPTLSGEWFDFLGQGQRATLVVITEDGEKHQYSLPAGMSNSGFLLSPLLGDTKSFLDFWTHRLSSPSPAQTVTELRLEQPPDKGYFKRKTTVRFYSYRF